MNEGIMPRRSFTHFSMVGLFMDLFCLFVSGAALFGVASGSALPSPSSSSSSPASDIAGSVLIGLITLIIFLAILFRKSRFVIECSEMTVTVKSYRILGSVCLLEQDKKEFAHSELGALVLDTQLRTSFFTWSNCLCCCCCGFNGIYVTKGFPRNGESLQIAFEIPCYHLTQYSPLYHGCHIKTYETSFHALIECLQFTTFGVVDSHSQVTTPAHETVIRGTWADHQMETVHNMQYGMEAVSDDAKANYRNFLAYNPRCQERTPRTKLGGKGIHQHRAVYFFCESADSAPAPLPAHQATPVVPPTTVQFSAADFDLIRARNKATLDHLLAIWTANDCNRMIQSIPSLYRADYTCSSSTDQQPATYGKFSDLPAAFNYIFNTLGGKYYNCEVLPDQDNNPCILRGRNKIHYPTSEYDCWFTIRFDDRGLMAHGDYFAQKCT